MNEQERLKQIKEDYFERGEVKTLNFDYLIQQAEEKQELEEHKKRTEKILNEIIEERDKVLDYNEGLARRIDELKQQNERYQEALKFYGAEHNYDEYTIGSTTIKSSNVMEDEGEKARQALQNK
ncbi:hypothetical protein [Gracilibacillus lacisalsi]|uniref:hypothetical protein n=1 Tax=Gracilibacillus lacisalsi TaxID=393087 RepID=UPI000369B7EE|nr:hypothetical protein [Gracilibacillus lacisalsi]